MKKRILIATASIITLLGIILLAVFANAAEADPELKIVGCNLSFQDNIYIKYAVDGSDLSDVKLLIWTSEQTSYEFGTQSAVLESTGTETVSGKPCKIYSYSSLTARMMTDYVYARAYVVKSGTAYYSPVKKYSILQYVLNKTGKTGTASTNQKLIDLLNAMIDYGSAAQIYAGYKADRLANSDWYQVKVVGGTLDDLSTEGLYLPGDSVTMTAPATDDQGQAFSYWETNSGEVAGTEATLTVTVVSLNKIYTAVYGSEIPDVPPTGDSEGLAYSDNGDGTCTITGIGTCTDTVITVPSEIEGLTVTAIGTSAFANQEQITKITLPDTIISIGRRAYYYCTNLKETNIPANVTSIGQQPFFHSGIENVTYSSNVGFSDSEAIFSGTGLKSITFNGQDIPSSICYNCTMLTDVAITNGTEYIGDNAFSGCIGLEGIEIPDSVTCISDYAFSDCTKLSSISMPSSGTSIGYGAFQNCTSLESITIPVGVTSIRDHIFYGCTNLESITIPDSVTGIRESAFYYCTNLESVTIPDSVTIIDQYAFQNCTSLKSITIPDSVLNIGFGAFWGCNSLTSVTIPDSMTSIDNSVFRECTSLARVTIPDTVMSIEYLAFNGSRRIQDVYYIGARDDWNSIAISEGNQSLTSARVHCLDDATPSVESVTTVSQFHAMNPNGSYRLDADLVITETYGAGDTPVIFSGCLDGNGHTVTAYAPLFASLSGTVKNLTIEGEIEAEGNVGALATVISAEVYYNIGTYAVIENCVNKANVVMNAPESYDNDAIWGAGGFIGSSLPNCGVKFLNCENQGNVTIICQTYNTAFAAGGFAGACDTFVARDCVNRGTVVAEANMMDVYSYGKTSLAGFVGRAAFTAAYNYVNIEFCTNDGIIGEYYTEIASENPKEIEQTESKALTNYLTPGARYAGGFCGYAGVESNYASYSVGNTPYRFYGNINNGSIYSTGWAGGIAGYLYCKNGNNSQGIDIQFNLVNGTIVSSKWCSAFVAYTNSVYNTMKYNVSTAEIERLHFYWEGDGYEDPIFNDDSFVFIGCSNANYRLNSEVHDNYIVDDNGKNVWLTYAESDSNAANRIDFTWGVENNYVSVVTSEQLFTGEITFSINSTAGINGFNQTIGVDFAPTPNTDSLYVVQRGDGYVNSETPELPLLEYYNIP